MNILVIGGAGFIGSVACETFINNKHNVIVLDDLSTGFKKLIHKKARFYKGSMLNEKILQKIFRMHKIDIVVLYAAKIVVPESVAKPIDYYKTNVTGVTCVLEAMKNNNVNNIIFASSAAVYGNCETQPITEQSPLNPINPYGWSKKMCEQIIIDASKAFNLNYVIFRFFNVAGASNSNKFGMLKPKPTLLIPAINSNLMKKNPIIKIYGNDYNTQDGTCVRDYIDVRDLADAANLAIPFLSKDHKSGIFNLGSSKGYSVLEIVNRSLLLVNSKGKYIFEKRRPGDPDILITNCKKANTVLKWKPQHSIDDMITSDYKFRFKIFANLAENNE